MPNSNYDKKQFTVPGTVRKVIFVHHSGIQSFFLKILQFMSILLLLLMIYFIGVIAGTSGWHLRSVDQFSNWWPNLEKPIWSKIRSLDQDAERHGGNTVKALNDRMDDILKNQKNHLAKLLQLKRIGKLNIKASQHCESVNQTLNLILEQSIIQTEECKHYNQQKQKEIETINQSSSNIETSQDVQDVKQTTGVAPEQSTPANTSTTSKEDK